MAVKLPVLEGTQLEVVIENRHVLGKVQISSEDLIVVEFGNTLWFDPTLPEYKLSIGGSECQAILKKKESTAITFQLFPDLQDEGFTPPEVEVQRLGEFLAIEEGE